MSPALLLALALASPGARPPPSASAPPPAPPEGAAALEEVLETWLGAIHGQPSAAQWRALGPGAVAPLARVAADPAALPGRRARAATALSHLGGGRAREVVVSLAGDEAQPFGVRAAALEGAARLLPPEALAALVGPVLQRARRPADRAVAAEVLSAAAPASCPAVRARVARESAADGAGYSRALARCAATGR